MLLRGAEEGLVALRSEEEGVPSWSRARLRSWSIHIALRYAVVDEVGGDGGPRPE
jgi:hypothetical protein